MMQNRQARCHKVFNGSAQCNCLQLDLLRIWVTAAQPAATGQGNLVNSVWRGVVRCCGSWTTASQSHISLWLSSTSPDSRVNSVLSPNERSARPFWHGGRLRDVLLVQLETLFNATRLMSPNSIHSRCHRTVCSEQGTGWSPRHSFPESISATRTLLQQSPEGLTSSLAVSRNRFCQSKSACKPVWQNRIQCKAIAQRKLPQMF